MKVIKGILGEAENKYFTATPSIRFLNALNYSQEYSQENNSVSTGKAFSTRFLGRGKYATRHEHFVNFRQDGRYSLPDGTGGNMIGIAKIKHNSTFWEKTIGVEQQKRNCRPLVSRGICLHNLAL